MRGAMPTHLGANPRNHVKHLLLSSSLENFYYYSSKQVIIYVLYVYGNERNIIITIYILRWYNTYILLANIIVVSYSDTSCMTEYLELLVLHACYFKYSEILLASESDTFAPPKVEGVV